MQDCNLTSWRPLIRRPNHFSSADSPIKSNLPVHLYKKQPYKWNFNLATMDSKVSHLHLHTSLSFQTRTFQIISNGIENKHPSLKMNSSRFFSFFFFLQTIHPPFVLRRCYNMEMEENTSYKLIIEDCQGVMVFNNQTAPFKRVKRQK